MGFLKGSASFTRFMVTRPLPGDYLEAFPQHIMRYAFKNLDESSDEERRIGWVNMMDMFDIQNLGREAFKDPYLALSLRVDVRKVPATALKQHCREAEMRIKAEDGVEFIPKKRREEIRDFVKQRLIRRAIPRSNTYDMLWDLKTGVVFFGSVSNKICGEFQEIFFKTFDLLLGSVFPYSLAYGLLEAGKGDPEQLDDLRPIGFTGEAS